MLFLMANSSKVFVEMPKRFFCTIFHAIAKEQSIKLEKVHYPGKHEQRISFVHFTDCSTIFISLTKTDYYAFAFCDKTSSAEEPFKVIEL